ncbi:Ig-like domain-containing protein [Algoriphagus locisalis]|uniref:Ig-like domain-containing protein n=1 Tax=Algoriphagus locisalis TaxID=305507 RepID=A0A1I7D8M6_9BACT|nr:Ig-like domain-containing domain [Algoriphagus locisalis]SFU07914.1 Ig-like domain-containing protein [Algoriphagus locisalis]
MKLNNLIILLFVSLLAFSCAKQSTPMGGPQDEDPPVVLEMTPKDQSLNTKPEEITLVFDEYIKLDNANKNILITPRINKDEVIFTALKNTLVIELNQELEDSTTYVFNFQKSITDLSEGNPAENLKLVFSTGESIDSLNVSGSVNTYFPGRNDKLEDAIVGLYPLVDTTNVFIAPPYYLSQVDSSGNFNISNIKAGKYLAYAWQDDNNSLKAEYKSEAFDFIRDTITIDQNIDGIQFNLSKGDQNPIRLLRSSTLGSNYTIVLNKTPIEVTLENEEMGKEIFYTLGDKRINLFSKQVFSDSLAFNVSLKDSVGYQIDSLIWTKFEESDRNPEKLTTTANSGKSFYRNLPIELTFNKPIRDINYDSLYLSYDTASMIAISPDMLRFKDSLRRDILEINLLVPDSIPFETFSLKAADSTFLDIEGQYNEVALSANYKKLKTETLADAISGKIEGSEGPFIIQLLDSKGELKRESYLDQGNQFSFTLIESGNYQIRIIEDSNGNRRWDPANFEERRYAERTFDFIDPETGTKNITIRGGWKVEDIVITAQPKTGLRTNPN